MGPDPGLAHLVDGDATVPAQSEMGAEVLAKVVRFGEEAGGFLVEFADAISSLMDAHGDGGVGDCG